MYKFTCNVYIVFYIVFYNIVTVSNAVFSLSTQAERERELERELERACIMPISQVYYYRIYISNYEILIAPVNSLRKRDSSAMCE